MGDFNNYLQYKIKKRLNKLLNTNYIIKKEKISNKKINKNILKYLNKIVQLKKPILKFSEIKEIDFNLLRPKIFIPNQLTKEDNWRKLNWESKYIEELKSIGISFKRESEKKVVSLIKNIIEKNN